MAKDLVGEWSDEIEADEEHQALLETPGRPVRRSELSRMLPEMLASLGVQPDPKQAEDQIGKLTDITMSSIKSLSQLAEFLASIVMNAEGHAKRPVSLGELLGSLGQMEDLRRAP